VDLEDAFSKTMKKLELKNNLTAFTLGRRLALGENLLITSQKKSQVDLLSSSIGESSLFKSNLLKELFKEKTLELKLVIPTYLNVSEDFQARYIHDLIIYDRGFQLNNFIKEVSLLVDLYKTEELFNIAIKALVKTYFIKDEIYIAHIMVSPMRKYEDQVNYNELGTSIKKTFINRPSFNIGKKKLEFDFSPSEWMLKMMRHCRFLRVLLPQWHMQERLISLEIRHSILSKSLNFKELKALENIKGYREVRYDIHNSINSSL
jgi:indolepyruvate ferredoxin oxidoreductase